MISMEIAKLIGNAAQGFPAFGSASRRLCARKYSLSLVVSLFRQNEAELVAAPSQPASRQKRAAFSHTILRRSTAGTSMNISSMTLRE
jgi:hypothetical protein